MEKFARPGDFCPNEACADYGKLQTDQQMILGENGRLARQQWPQN